MTPDERLAELGVDLSTVPPPAGSYVSAVRARDLVFLSGQGPLRDGNVLFSGMVGQDLTLEEGYDAARVAGLNLLAALHAETGTLSQVHRVVKLLGWVNSAPGFVQQPAVLDGASDVMVEVLGSRGRHARSALPSGPLAFNMSVEVEMVVQLKPEAKP